MQRNLVVSITPAQAYRISQEAAKIGATVGVSQSGSYHNALIIDTGRGFHVIDVSGSDVESY
jgi:hypothetical protein